MRNLFRFLGRQVEYAVRWNRPYTPGIWVTLHELYFDLGERKDLFPEPGVPYIGDAFDLENEDKCLLLLGLVGERVAPADRSDRRIDELPSSARECRLESPASDSGAFAIFCGGTRTERASQGIGSVGLRVQGLGSRSGPGISESRRRKRYLVPCGASCCRKCRVRCADRLRLMMYSVAVFWTIPILEAGAEMHD